jgi:hypothetical protein
MARELSGAGFTNIRRAVMAITRPRFADAEDEGRWKNCLGMKCQR